MYPPIKMFKAPTYTPFNVSFMCPIEANATALVMTANVFRPWAAFYLLPPWLYAYVQSLWFYMSFDGLLTYDQVFRIWSILLQFVLIPLAYACLMRPPTPQLSIIVSDSKNQVIVHPGVPTEGEMDSDLDEEDKEILTHLSRNPDGSPIMKIWNSMLVNHPHVERCEVNNRLYRLLGEKRVELSLTPIGTVVWLKV